MKLLIYLFLVCIFYSCNEYGSKISTKSESDETIVMDLLQMLKQLEENHDSVNFNLLVHDQLGLHFISESESKIQLDLIDNYSELNVPEGIFQFKMIETGELPKLICEGINKYGEHGFYCGTNNSLLEEQHILLNAVHESHQVALGNIISSIEVSAIKTSGNVTSYYFSKVDGKWYITFLDLRDPCD